MKTYEQINAKIESGKAVVMTAEEIIGYVEAKGLEAVAEEVDVVTTAIAGALIVKSGRIGLTGRLPELVANRDAELELKVTRDPNSS